MNPKRTGKLIKSLLKFVIMSLMVTTPSLVGAQTLQALYSFHFTDGSHPGTLTLGEGGDFYGTTYHGGSYGSNVYYNYGYGYGTVFVVTINGTLTTLVDFNYTNGANPGNLTLGSDGNLYGTTQQGGSNGYGTAFMVTTSGTLTTLVDFNYTNGANPGNLTLGSDGNFYGIAGGGSRGQGLVFKMTTNGTLSDLVNFHIWAGNGYVSSDLTLGSDGNFYGTAYSGGGGYGAVSEVTTNGMLTTLFDFNGNNGRGPGALTFGNDGNLYGTTDFGTFFQVATNGTITTLASFDAFGPGDLTKGSDGNFYGSTVAGGSWSDGTIFQVTPKGEITTLVNIDSEYWEDRSALTFGSDGNLYGTTLDGAGGVDGDGLIFAILIPLTITVQPQNQTNFLGTTATFTVIATGPNPISDPIGYQWQKNGANLVNGGKFSGATSNTLTITDISAKDAASYSVIVSNANTSVKSSNAVLRVIRHTRIIHLIGNLAFGSVPVGSISLRTLTIANNGNSTLTVRNIRCPFGFRCNWSGSIPPGNSTNITVTFAPTLVIRYGGEIIVNSDATSGTNWEAVSGTGTPVVFRRPHTRLLPH